MQIFVCGGVDENIKPKYLEGISELAIELIKLGHSVVCVGAQTGAIGELYNTYLQNNGSINVLVPDCYVDDAKNIMPSSITSVKNLYELQQTALKNSDATIILPGGNGTLAEMYMSIDNIKAGFDTDPILIFNINGFYDIIKDINKHLMQSGVMRKFQNENFVFCSTPKEILKELKKIKK